MSLLEWKDEFTLGVAAMDNDHRGLVAAMNSVYDLAKASAPKDRIEAAMVKLVDLTKKHFADEEVHMDKIGFPGAARHKLIHQDMLRRAGDYFAAFQAGNGTVDESFFEFLVHWLGAHICHIDRKYVDHAAPVGSPGR